MLYVQTGCRFPTVDLWNTSLNHLQIDILAVQQERFTESPSIPVSTVRFHIDDLVQDETGEELGRLLPNGCVDGDAVVQEA